MADRKVRIGFVGAGNMGQTAHLANYTTLPDCEVVALAELRQETARAVAARYGIPRVYRDHRELLEAERLDGVVASQPFERHAVLLPEIYGRVPCVFTEKPLAVSVATGEHLARLARQTGTVHMVGYNKRSDLATTYAMETIAAWRASGEMGALRYLRLTMPAGDWIASGFSCLINAGAAAPVLGREPADAEFPGEAGRRYVEFINYFVHQVNLLRYLAGEPYRVMHADRAGLLLVAETTSGISATIELSPYRTTVAWEETALVAFEKGYIFLRLPAPLAVNRAGTVEVYADPGGRAPLRTQPTLPWIGSMRQQAVNFVKVCRGEMVPPCDAAEAVEDLKVCRDYIRLLHAHQKED